MSVRASRYRLHKSSGQAIVILPGRDSILASTPLRKPIASATGSSDPGPLLVRPDRAAAAPDPLTAGAVCRLVRALGERAGLSRLVQPHGLRHQAITAALDATEEDVRSAAVFSRHRDIRIVAVSVR